MTFVVPTTTCVGKLSSGDLSLDMMCMSSSSSGDIIGNAGDEGESFPLTESLSRLSKDALNFPEKAPTPPPGLVSPVALVAELEADRAEYGGCANTEEAAAVERADSSGAMLGDPGENMSPWILGDPAEQCCVDSGEKMSADPGLPHSLSMSSFLRFAIKPSDVAC